MNNVLILLLVSLIVVGCNRNKFDVDVSNIDIKIKAVRLEKEMFDSKLNDVNDLLPNIANKYNGFFSIYSKYIDDIHPVNDSLFNETFVYFITDYHYNKIFNKCIKVFPDINEITDGLTQAYKHIKYYYPNEKVPYLYTCIIPTPKNILLTDNFLGISIDKYLGRNNKEYKEQGFYQYQINNMYKKKIVSDCIIEWAKNKYPLNDSINNLSDYIIYYGEIMYLVDAILPNENDSIKFGFTGQQLQFCQENEKKMWLTLVENKSLFVTDPIVIKKFIDDGPFTRDFHSKSPARSVIWLGREIIRDYINREKCESLDELLKNNNTQEILNISRYNP